MIGEVTKSNNSKALYETAKDFLLGNDQFLVSTHVNPDGDGLGSALALGWLLKKLNKTYTIVVDGKKPQKFGFLHNYDSIESLSSDHLANLKSSLKSLCVVDSPTLERIGKIRDLLPPKIGILNVDHHVSNAMFGFSNLVDAESSSSSQIVYNLVKRFGFPIDRHLAEYIYTGICVDTGRFHFSSTSADTFRVAAELVEAGVEPSEVGNALYFDNHPATLNGLGVMLSSMEIHFQGRVASAVFGYDYLRTDAGQDMDTEGFVNYPLSIRGVDVSILLHENQPNQYRVSLRSKNKIDVNEVAGVFRGGGHKLAAGCRLEGVYADVLKRLLDEIRNQYKKEGLELSV